MDIQMQLYWQAYSEDFTTNDLIRMLYNPLRDYENEFVYWQLIVIKSSKWTELLIRL